MMGNFCISLLTKAFITKLNPSSQTVFVVASLSSGLVCPTIALPVVSLWLALALPVVSLRQAAEGLCVGEELEANVSRFWKTSGECWKGLRSVVILYVIFRLNPSSY